MLVNQVDKHGRGQLEKAGYETNALDDPELEKNISSGIALSVRCGGMPRDRRGYAGG